MHRHFLSGGRLLSEEIEDYAPDEIPLIKVRKFVAEPAKVGTELYQQWNMGNDNLIATRIFIHVPCYREEADDAYIWADRWATQKMQIEAAKIEELRSKVVKKSAKK